MKNKVLLPRFAAMCRSKFRGRANENGKFNLPRKHARLCGINSTAQTHKKNRVLLPRFSPKEKRAAMCRSNFRGRASLTRGLYFMGFHPKPRPLFKKSGGKTMLYRQASRSLRSCDAWRLF